MRRAAAAMGLFVFLAGCGASGQPPNGFTMEELRRATYRGLAVAEGPITLNDGEWEGSFDGGAVKARVWLWSEEPVTGNLDDDADGEAVVVLAESGGGTGTFYTLAVMERSAEGPVQAAAAYLGDRVDIAEVRIEDGRIVMELTRAGPQDPACCPTERVRQTWSYSGSGLTGGSTVVLGP